LENVSYIKNKTDILLIFSNFCIAGKCHIGYFFPPLFYNLFAILKKSSKTVLSESIDIFHSESGDPNVLKEENTS